MILLALLLAAIPIQVPAEPNFVCPDSQPTQAARDAEVDAFVHGMWAQKKPFTPQDFMRIRLYILRSHNCVREHDRLLRNLNSYGIKH